MEDLDAFASAVCDNCATEARGISWWRFDLSRFADETVFRARSDLRQFIRARLSAMLAPFQSRRRFRSAREPYCWWGQSYVSVVLKPYQYSSFNANDPQCDLYPQECDLSYQRAKAAAAEVLGGCDDQSLGADSYHDDSIPPPEWATAPGSHMTYKIGRLNFYRTI